MAKIFLPQETLSAIKFNSHIFVDTCFFLDFAFLSKRDKEDLLKNWALIIKGGGVFVTIEPVVIEFLLGSSTADLKIKRDYISQLIETVIPVTALQKNIIESLIKEYGVYARGNVSYVDLCLASAIRQYPNTFLLTRNHSDFPLKIFSSQGLFAIHLNKAIRTYCLYAYGKEKPKKKDNKDEIPF
jgi:hypothetical protein